MTKGHIQRCPREGKALEGFLANGHIQHSQGHRPWNAVAPEHVWPKAIFIPFATRRANGTLQHRTNDTAPFLWCHQFLCRKQLFSRC